MRIIKTSLSEFDKGI